MDIKNYKCPSCSGTLSFNSQKQEMMCDFCKNTFSVETVEEFTKAVNSTQEQSEFQWKTYGELSGNGEWKEEEANVMKVYSCPSCGAEIVSDTTTAATFCLYCGNNTIIPEQFDGFYRPDYVIPFKVDKKQAKEALMNFCKKKPLLPNLFIDQNRIEKITGIYVPFWLFDCDADANITYNATRVHMWSDDEYNYTKTDHFMIYREGGIGFDNIPADGSSKADDTFMESIEPFDFSEAVDFTTAYLSGYLADKYDVSAEDNKERVNNRIQNSTLEAFRSTVNGYHSVTTNNSRICVNQGCVKYVLMPVWMLNTKYQGKNYTFALNGQTGKIAGELPISWGKFFSWMFGIAGVVSTLAIIIYLVAF